MDIERLIFLLPGFGILSLFRKSTAIYCGFPRTRGFDRTPCGGCGLVMWTSVCRTFALTANLRQLLFLDAHSLFSQPCESTAIHSHFCQIAFSDFHGLIAVLHSKLIQESIVTHLFRIATKAQARRNLCPHDRKEGAI
jgi:hypothetical protein